jgi:hypothetical protein
MYGFQLIGEKLKKTLLILGISFLALVGPSLAQQWSPPVRISEVTGGYYPNILACGDTLHVVYQGNYPDKIEYIRSIDGGLSWGRQHLLADTINTEYLTNPYVMQFEGDLLTVWHSSFVHGIYTYNIGYSSSHNGGMSWTAPQYALENNLLYPYWLTASASDSIVNITISMHDYAIDSTVFYNIRSTNFGRDWSAPRRLFRSYGGGGMEQASYGDFVQLAWNGRVGNAQRTEIYYKRSTDGGISWEPSIALSDTDRYYSQLPAICTGDSGKVFVTWMDYKYTTQMFTGDILLRVSSDSGITWSQEQQLTFNHFAYRSDVTVNGDTIHVAWEDESHSTVNRAIGYLRSSNNGINWDGPVWIDGTEDDSHSPASATSNGRVYVIWYDDREPPEDIGLYFSRWDPEPNAIDNDISFPKMPFLSAYPNPFNSATTITQTGAEQYEIGIYDITGRLITILHTVGGQALWDASAYSSGLYFARLAGEKAGTIKLILLR